MTPGWKKTPPSSVKTCATYTFTSVPDGEPTTLDFLLEETNALINQNKSLTDCNQYLLTSFDALEKD